MTNNTIILFGANGGIGSCLKEQLEQDNHIISVCSDDIDFTNENSCQRVKDIIIKITNYQYFSFWTMVL